MLKIRKTNKNKNLINTWNDVCKNAIIFSLIKSLNKNNTTQIPVYAPGPQ